MVMIFDKRISDIPEINITDFQKNSPGFLILSLDEYHTTNPNKILNPHRLSFYQLILIMEGEGFYTIDAEKYRIEPKTLFTISKGQIEEMKFLPDVKGYAILFIEEFIYKNPEDIGWINNLKLFDNSANPYRINLSDEEYVEFLILLVKIGIEFDIEDDFAKEGILLNLLKTLLLKSERIKRKNINDDFVDIEDLSCLVKFKEILEEHYNESRAVNFYSDLLNITPKRLSQVTSNYWGKSAKQVIEERVLLEIKRLLIHKNQSVKEIGISLGFYDPTNFNKFFKKYQKITPAEYRLSHKNDRLYHKKASINHSL